MVVKPIMNPKELSPRPSHLLLRPEREECLAVIFSGSQGANFTTGGRELFASRPREVGDSLLVKSAGSLWRIREKASN